MTKRKLPGVTLLGIDCLNIERLLLAADISEKGFEFAETKLLTSLPSRDHRIVQIAPVTTISEYCEFVIRHLDRYVSTEFVIIIQHDGFILNPDAWTDDFLGYDYIGAPWVVQDWAIEHVGFPKEWLGQKIVGNGGFSLRSKKLLALGKELADAGTFSTYFPEDAVLCVHHRALLEERGIQFAPVEVAAQFSFEAPVTIDGKPDPTHGPIAWDGQLGFHGIRWTDISNWSQKHAEYNVDRVQNSISYRTLGWF